MFDPRDPRDAASAPPAAPWSPPLEAIPSAAPENPLLRIRSPFVIFGLHRSGAREGASRRMSDPARAQLETALRRTSDGDLEAEGDVVRALASELAMVCDRGDADEDGELDPVAAFRHVSVRALTADTRAELLPELERGVALAFMALLRDLDGEGRPLDGPLRLPARSPGAAPRSTEARAVAAALVRMEQLKEGGSLLGTLSVVMDLSVDRCAGALRRPSDRVQPEWAMARAWMARELDLRGESQGA